MSIRGVLVDLSGTLHIDDLAICGASVALKKLHGLELPVKFLTNTTKESQNTLFKRLVSLGFDVQKSEIFTSLIASKKYIQEKGLRPYFIMDDRAMEDFVGIETQNPNAVVIGLVNNKFNYNCMNEAFRLLLKGGELVAIHKAKYYKTSDGLALGPGSFVHGLEFATEKTATVIGKPNPKFFEMGMQALDGPTEPENIVMIGDDVNDDILGAISVGMKGILVKTGKYRNDDELKIPEDRRNCVKSFVEAVDLIEQQKVR